MRGWKRRRISLNILIVKLSSLGDVVHTLPAVQDIRRALPQAHIDWVVEPGFAALVRRCEGVRRVIPCAMRLWSKHWMRASTRAAWLAFNAELGQVKYDAVIDCQGLTKSAIVARCAQLTQTGKRYALANKTDGSSYEAPTRWLTDVAVPIAPRTPAVQRTRLLCAQALGYAAPHDAAQFSLLAQTNRAQAASKTIAFIHGTSRADKCWSELHWVQLGKKLCAQGLHIALLHGNDEEEQRSQRIAKALGAGAHVWPRLPLDALTDQLSLCAGAIGVDSGLAHIAVALDLPHVQIYNFDTAWRTGPIDLPRQCSVFASPQPSVAQVWDAWQRVQTQAPIAVQKA
jgi:heptosyltransferase I